MHPVALALYLFAVLYVTLYSVMQMCYAIRYSGKDGTGNYSVSAPFILTAVLITVGALIDANL